jgi:hypothetical protein
MQPGSRSSDGDTEDACDLRQLIPEIVVENDNGSLLRRQPAEAAIELVP